jgi:cyclic-di-GMP phosphodiesterase TipF (flagellum assembly factor)
MPAIDHMQVMRALEIARRLEARRQEIGLLCGLSVATLGDGEFFQDFLALLEANKPLAPRLVFGLAQALVKTMGPIEIEALRTLADLGFRFALVEAGDLRVDAQELAGHGFRFVKVPVGALLGEAVGTDIHPADFAALLARFGLTLIVDGVARESAVPELLEYGVRCAQGALFGAARLVRAEASALALPQAAE